MNLTHFTMWQDCHVTDESHSLNGALNDTQEVAFALVSCDLFLLFADTTGEKSLSFLFYFVWNETNFLLPTYLPKHCMYIHNRDTSREELLASSACVTSPARKKIYTSNRKCFKNSEQKTLCLWQNQSFIICTFSKKSP